jgi:NMD protein affecting ribosome stability and mRNA decay
MSRAKFCEQCIAKGRHTKIDQTRGANARYCPSCGADRVRESKRIWQARWRARARLAQYDAQRGNNDPDEETQRRVAAFSEDFEKVILGPEEDPGGEGA